MSYGRPDKLRRVAVLVASLDAELAQSLLDEMPPTEAARVRELVEQIDEIDPEEHADVVAEFRRSVKAPAPNFCEKLNDEYGDTVEIEASLADEIDRLTAEAAESSRATQGLERQLAQGSAPAVARRLHGEHPQTIAVILSRLPEPQAAAVFDALPVETQTPVLERLANSSPADEEAVAELEGHLSQWLEQHQRQQAHQAAGSELARRLSARSTTAAPRDDSHRRHEAKPKKVSPRWSAPTPTPAPSEVPAGKLPQFDPAGLAALDDRTLIAVLSEADERSAQLALAAGGDELLKRILRRMPRGAARRLRNQIRSLGPVQLSELDDAQQELLRLAHSR